MTCGYPIAARDGHDSPRLIDERVPGVAAVIDDVVEGFENSVRQPILSSCHLVCAISGYYAGKRGSTVFEPQRVKEIAEKVKSECLLKANSKLPVMEVIKKIQG